MLQTITYTYGDSNWKDKMTAYNGSAITYDVIGNPTNDGTWTYTWEKGRQLKQMSKSGTTATFLYNADGLRIRKTVGSTVTNYTLHGKNIVHLTQGSNSLHFFYDAQNRPAIVNYNGTKYAYQYSLQGDVIGLIDTNGTQVVRYVYDAWGKVLSTTGSLASTLGTVQPFRYRGYVYDTETGLYYLRSRYYYPTWQRFLNADKVISDNLFNYCKNAPINLIDINGKEPESIQYGYIIGTDYQLYDYYDAILGTRVEVLSIHENFCYIKYKSPGGTSFYGVVNSSSIILDNTYDPETLDNQYFKIKNSTLSTSGMAEHIEKTRILQMWINRLYAYLDVQNVFPLSVDGKFDENVKVAVMKIQNEMNKFPREQKLIEDGIAGKNTIYAMYVFLIEANYTEKYHMED